MYYIVTDATEKEEMPTILYMRFVAFPATEYDEVFSGYQPGQMVEW
jgi:hypothetical protein